MNWPIIKVKRKKTIGSIECKFANFECLCDGDYIFKGSKLTIFILKE